MAYHPGMTTVVFDSEGKGHIVEPEETENYSILKDIYEAVIQNNYDKFIKLYPKYLSDSSVEDYIHYTFDHPPAYCDEFYYDLCNCYPDEDAWYDNIHKVHKYCYTSKCTCANGKKYCMLRQAYEEAGKRKTGNESCYSGWTSIQSLYNHFKMTDQDKSKIIQYIESYDKLPVYYNFEQYIGRSKKHYKFNLKLVK